jgi:hypothetical protein
MIHRAKCPPVILYTIKSKKRLKDSQGKRIEMQLITNNNQQ